MRDFIVSGRGMLLAMAVVGLAGPAGAAPLGLTKQYPDVAALSSVQTSYDYNAALGQFQVTGGISQYAPNATTSYVAGGGTGLRVIANVNAGGGLFGGPGGTLVINGVVPQIGIYVPVNLLTADLTAFGYSGAGSSTVFEFTGNVTGGALQTAFGSQIGMIINPGTTGFNGSFGSSFSGSGGTVDTFAIPEPATMLLLAAGAAGLAGRRRRQ